MLPPCIDLLTHQILKSSPPPCSQHLWETLGSGKTNLLLNLIKQQPDIDKIYIYVKEPFESKYQLLIMPFIFYKQSIFDPCPENCFGFSKKSPQKIV